MWNYYEYYSIIITEGDIGMNPYTRAIKEYKEKHGFTNEQIAKQLNVDTSTVTKIVNGTSKFVNNTTKERIANLLQVNLEELENHFYSFKKPLIGSVKAGYNLFAEENFDSYIPVSSEDNLSGDFFLRVVGDSMTGSKIFDNDLLFVQQTNNVQDGDIAIVLIENNEVTVKRIQRRDNLLILEATNAEYETRYYTKEQVKSIPIQILGKVIYSKTNH